MKLRNPHIIHIFAAAHFAASLLCGALSLSDSLLLTALTIALILLLCLRRRTSEELTVISIVLANIIGYFLGELLALAFGLVLSAPVLAHALSTAATTEALGWATLWFTGRYNIRSGPAHQSGERLGAGMGKESDAPQNSGATVWLVSAVAAVYLLRVFINLMLSSSAEGMQAVRDFLYNPLMLLLILGAGVVFIRYYRRGNNELSYPGKILTFALYFVFMTLLSALFVGLGLPFGVHFSMTAERFLLLLAVGLVSNAIIFSFTYVADLALTARRRLEIEKERADKAHYRYLLMKQQLKPHFLFNSLNVLDSLVQDGSKEDASRFIHGLSGLYRYMLRNEDEVVVPLVEELEYANMYSELVRMRWQDALIIQMSVPYEDMGRFVVPGSVQLCMENAIKHNSMSPENPLEISISSDGSCIKVHNRLSPKIGEEGSTGLGLKYIKEQYLSCGKSVEIDENEEFFEVRLPLL